MRVILGIWDFNAREMDAAARLASQFPDTVVGLIIGNETLLRGGKIEALQAAFRIMRILAPDVPLSTSEPITSYGQPLLRELPDFQSPNCHWIFNSPANMTDTTAAVAWTKERAQALRRLTGEQVPVLVKESGLPSSPLPFTPELQREFWKQAFEAFKDLDGIALAAFEAFSLPFKPRTNPSPLAASEAHWGFWEVERTPKHVVEAMPAAPTQRERK